MSQSQLVIKLVSILESAGIEYMITGSIVSSIQGEPRSTHDIDIVVALNRSHMETLISAFPSPDFYIDKQAVLTALEEKNAFNVIDVIGGGKIDFWILTDDDFDKTRFSRVFSFDFMGIPIRISTPEDTILAKLRWAKLSGGSRKQFIDALRVYEVQHEQLDLRYIEYWTDRLAIKELWRQLLDEAITL